MIILENGSYASLVVGIYGLGEVGSFVGEQDFHVHYYENNKVIFTNSKEVMPYWLQLGDKIYLEGEVNKGVFEVVRISRTQEGTYYATLNFGGNSSRAVLMDSIFRDFKYFKNEDQ